MSHFISINRSTDYLLPPSVDEWLPANHLARFVVEVVDQLDLSAITRAYAGRGSAAHHPSVLLGLLIYGYASGTFHSRKIERATYDSLAFRFIAANSHPDHDTIASFRSRFASHIEPLFVQVLLIAREMKMLKLGAIALDGTKLKANASRSKALSWAHLLKIEQELQRQVQELVQKASNADANDLPDGLDIPAEIERRQKRLSVMAKAKATLQARAQERDALAHAQFADQQARRQAQRDAGRKPVGRPPHEPPTGPQSKDQVSLTDEDARIMPASNGAYEQAYNAQASVDTQSRLIVGIQVSQATNDKHQMAPMLECLQALPAPLGKVHTVLADTGYFSRANAVLCDGAGIEPMICAQRQAHHTRLQERFGADAPKPQGEEPLEQMLWRLKTQAGKALYGLRKSTVEPVFGVIKQVMGFRQFSLRGLDKVSAEWSLVTLAYNVKRMNVLRTA
jgi:transposase